MKSNHRQWRPALVAGLLWSLAGGARLCGAAEKPSREGLDFFEKSVRPLLVARCYECHSASAKKLKGHLRLDHREGLLQGGDTGPAVVPGSPEKSLLIKAVHYADPDLRMPPKQPLSPAEVADLETWIKMGAPVPRDSDSAKPAPVAGIDLAAARKFWSFQPVSDPAPPSVRDQSWPRAAFDRFILARLEACGLAPGPSADKRTLLRRATFDLLGLPPTPEELEAFLHDRSPNSFEKVIDRLLASPHYGERWGRHWLDLVRYADTSGCNSDYPVPTAYKYRNYVITAFNQDKPYDQFLREQVGGDLLPAKSEEERFEHIVATGYLAMGRRFGSRASEFHLTIEDLIDNLGKTTLGLSVSCARCHDHKFDPIPTRDYYALYGIFNSTRYAFPGTEIYRHPKDYIPLAPAAAAEAYFKDASELAQLDDKVEKLLERKRSFERSEKALVAKAEMKNGAAPVERKDHVKLPEAMTLTEVKAELEDARNRQRFLENKTYPFEKAYAVTDAKPANARVQKKGDPGLLGDEVPRGFLQILGGQQVPAGATNSGRYELAQWLTDPKNPLTARVLVNRLWQHHFGKGLVQTPNDFGARGKAPTHPELLDYLASRFLESGWSIKALHRLLMLSATYQLSSEPTEAPGHLARGIRSKAGRKSAAANPAAADPNNDLLSHFNRRRLDAEEVRDAMLAISGRLEAGMGGPHPFPPEKEWHYTQHEPFVAVYETRRRSVYLMQQRIKKHPFLEIFDGADANAATAERTLNTTPLQALFMMNDPFAHEQADQLAVRIGLAFREDAERINYAFKLAFGRPATREEIRLGQDYLRRCATALKETALPADQQSRAALASYARVVLSSNEFMYVD